jgi:PAS domain S-box-containing protein
MDTVEHRVLIHAPTGRDAELASRALSGAGFVGIVSGTIAELLHCIEEGAGAILVAVEALTPEAVERFAGTLASQEPWSDLPIILLSFPESHGDMEREASHRLGNVVLLDRPLRIPALLSAIQSALRARSRQYQLRTRVEQLKRQASELAESEARYRVLAELAPDPLLVEHRGVIQYANLAASRVLGRPRESLVGMHRDELVTWSEEPRSGDHLAEEVWRTSSGALVPLEVAASDIRWDGKASRQVLARDVSARKELEEGLRSVARQKDEFLGLVSHELRTPLTIIRGVADLLQSQDAPRDPSRDESISMLVENADRLAAVVDNMLSLAQISHERLTTEPVLVAASVSHAVARHQRRFPGRMIETSVEPSIMNANAASVDQVLENLLSNAEKYSPSSGLIEVEARIACDTVAISIRDEGEGLDVEEIDHYFASFFRSKRRRHDQKPGAGLGLTVCKLLIEAQGGQIWARPRPSGGSEFGFELPRVDAEVE